MGVGIPMGGEVIQQGHRYRHGRYEVLAVETGEKVFVREIRPEEPGGLGPRYLVAAKWLEPLPMKYHGNQIP